ncbi:MAG: dTDP-4-dehydrorhamnose reductase [Thermoleophilaceae bacterium]|nr:dTDP-4-dehydrorhamnose reductase [Thermoleophilaceae bacterium]
MRILVTGAAGMLGTDVLRAVEAAGHEPVPATRDELDVTDAQEVESVVAIERPEAVSNCAAFTDVDGAEADPEGALAVNADGARNVAAAAAAVGAAVVYPSTDYVFDGEKREPYLESDATGPRSCYGESKLRGEHDTADANPRHHVVRTSWLFGSSGKNFVDTMLSLARERDELRVVDDQVGCPTYTGHLADGLVRLLLTEVYGVHHLAAAGQCSWYEFAREIFTRAGVDVRVEPCTTEEFPRPAPRPRYSVLGTEHTGAPLLPSWQEGLDGYLAERTAAR